MNLEDKKKAKCSNCEFYHNNVTASMPLGYCRNGYGSAIHTLAICPKQAAREQLRKEKEATMVSKPKLAAKPLPKAKPKKKKPMVKKTVSAPVVVVKTKRTPILEK